jgi:hypothetical protein
VLAFIEQTRACLLGRLRKAETLSGAEAAAFIHTLKRQLPEGTYRVLLCGDGEFLSWDSVAAAGCENFQFIFGHKVCQPVFDHRRWYRTRHRTTAEYNSCHKATCFEGGRGFLDDQLLDPRRHRLIPLNVPNYDGVDNIQSMIICQAPWS